MRIGAGFVAHRDCAAPRRPRPVLLVSFSLGLALVLMAIGVLVIYAKNLLPSSSGGNPFFRWMPVASAAVVMLLGVVMTGVSLGWIRPALDGGLAQAGNNFRPKAEFAFGPGPLRNLLKNQIFAVSRC